MDILIVFFVAFLILKVISHLSKRGDAIPPAVNPQPPAVPGADCKEYLNNTGSAITGVAYVSCSGESLVEQTVEPGQTICAQAGSLIGGGFLVELGVC